MAAWDLMVAVTLCYPPGLPLRSVFLAMGLSLTAYCKSELLSFVMGIELSQQSSTSIVVNSFPFYSF